MRKQPANRRIDKSVIESVAVLVSRGLTESEACRQLKIRPKAWFNFKSARRNNERFADLLEEFRASRVEDLIASIERSASGAGLKQRDWRAAKFLLEVLDRDRFNTDKPGSQTMTANMVLITADRAKQLAGMVELEVARLKGKPIDSLPAGDSVKPLAVTALPEVAGN